MEKKPHRPFAWPVMAGEIVLSREKYFSVSSSFFEILYQLHQRRPAAMSCDVR